MSIELQPGQTLEDYIEKKLIELLKENLILDIQADIWSDKRWEVRVIYGNTIITSDSFSI